MWFAQALELASHIAVIVASVVAIVGVSAWRREFRGKRDIELAEDVLCHFYRAERAMEAIRFPMYSLTEGQTRAPEPNESPEEKQARDRAHVTFKRIRDHANVFDELHGLRFRFMVRFGQEKAKPFDDMKWQISAVLVCARKLAKYWAVQSREGEHTDQSTQKEIEEYERVIWQMADNDEIASRVHDIILEVEGTCRPLIAGQNSCFSRLWSRVFHRKVATKP